MDSYNKLITINLPRFTEEEVKMFVKTLFPDIHISDKTLRKIYSETEGNTFFDGIFKYNKIQWRHQYNVYKDEGYTQKQILVYIGRRKKILNIASIFFDGVPLEILKI